MTETDVLVIGGGATGAGVAFDAALRGLSVVLVDRSDLGEGTSGRFHGLLHSGGRYVVSDPTAARECIAENRVLRRVARGAIEDTGGLYVTTPFDDPAYADRFAAGCRRSDVDCEELDVADVLAGEPLLNPRITRAFAVPDAAIDAWTTLRALRRGIVEHGGEVRTRCAVVAVHRDGDAIVGARLRERGGREHDVHAAVTVNAAGAWAGRIASLAAVEGVRVIPSRGIMIATNHRLVDTVVNRCERPGDGDALVPIRTVSVIGTTDEPTDDPDDTTIRSDEVEAMLDAGERLVPGFRGARALRVWAGVRPLYEDARPDGAPASSREVPRAHALLDHRARDGVTGFVTITGGKLTTYRLMAEQTVDAVCAQLDRDAPCATATTPLPGLDGDGLEAGARLCRQEASPDADQVVCECELVHRGAIERAARDGATTELDDIRRALRLGMGPCQGGFCTYRATAIVHEVHGGDADAAIDTLTAFLHERWKGSWPVLHSDQHRQALLDEWIFHGVLGLDRARG